MNLSSACRIVLDCVCVCVCVCACVCVCVYVWGREREREKERERKKMRGGVRESVIPHMFDFVLFAEEVPATSLT